MKQEGFNAQSVITIGKTPFMGKKDGKRIFFLVLGKWIW